MKQRLLISAVLGILTLRFGLGGAISSLSLSEYLALVACADDNPKANRPVQDRDSESEINLDKVADDELVGQVVDATGKPVEGVEVDVWTWYRGNETRTDRQGRFRLKGLGSKRLVEVQFSKQNYSPSLFWQQETGAAGWKIELTNKTYFEGQVTGSDGKRVPNALIRADRGPKRTGGLIIKGIWTETRSGPDGRYRLYVETDAYDIQVRVPGRGVARIEEGIQHNESKPLDIVLEKGIAFRAEVVDSISGEPANGIRIWDQRSPGIEGISDADGKLVIEDLFPGRFDFSIIAPGYARWWSEEAVSGWNRFDAGKGNEGWQWNASELDFNLTPGMVSATISVERVAKIKGRVVDPTGRAVTGAIVSVASGGPGAIQGWFTGFSATSDDTGRYELKVPASGAREYNLVAHDGKRRIEWRNWANGVTEPIATKPGELLGDVDIQLTRPAVVRGRVVDTAGRPVASRQVRAVAADARENYFYEPATDSDADGRFELKFIRPGQQIIQAAQAPSTTAEQVDLPPGGILGSVVLQVPAIDDTK